MIWKKSQDKSVHLYRSNFLQNPYFNDLIEFIIEQNSTDL